MLQYRTLNRGLIKCVWSSKLTAGIKFFGVLENPPFFEH